jgi:hypothetical protein
MSVKVIKKPVGIGFDKSFTKIIKNKTLGGYKNDFSKI